MKVQFNIGYNGYIVEQADVPVLMEIFTRARDVSDKFIRLSVEEAPDLARNALREEIKKELGDEAQKYSDYWLQERERSARLEKELRELKDNA